MNIILFRQARWLRAAGAVARRFMPQTPSAALRSDGQAVIYAAVSIFAGLSALYIGLIVMRLAG